MTHSTEEIQKHLKIYFTVFGGLMILTIVTVLASFLDVSVWLGVFIGLAIATVKGSMVGAFFMHLMWEKKMIFWILLLTVFFAAEMLALILWFYADVPTYG